MKKNYFLVMLVALIFVSCSKTDDPFVPVSESTNQNESGVLNKKGEYKKFDGRLTYNFTTAFDQNCQTCNEGSFTGNFLGSGNLNHLGKISSKTKACASYIFNETNSIIGLSIYNQCCIFIAPNGDELTLTTDGYDLYFNQSGVAVGTCEFDFAGGTGKYQNAAGSFTGKVNNYGNYFTVDVEGQLSY